MMRCGRVAVGLQALLFLLTGTLLAQGAAERKTWNGCKCKKAWTMDGKNCDFGCCNVDNDPSGDWCMVDDINCEDADWGYCRSEIFDSVWDNQDAGSANALAHAGPTGGGRQGYPAGCVDAPINWKDTDGEGCAQYVKEAMCNSNGGYGVGWDAEWGTFFDFAVDGVTAVEACCACGGGMRAGGFAPQEQCTDLAEWKDKDGDNCEGYVMRAWCNSTGYGVGWHEEWGTFTSFAVNGQTAFTACCACGGGKRDGSTALISRTTWNGCTCKKGWQKDGVKCDGYCCDADSSNPNPDGGWCVVEKPECEDGIEWGICRPLGALVAPGSTCGDDPPGWIDSEGDSCDNYQQEKYCNSFGGYGPGWDIKWGNFHTFMNHQRTAATACCKCGGGHTVWTPTLAQSCQDNANWKDKDGDSCSTYKSNGWCSEDGEGPGWHHEWGHFEAFSVNGISAVDACCHCGGGDRQRTFVQHIEVNRQRAVEVVQKKPWVLPAGSVVLLSICGLCCLCCCCIFRKHSPEEVAEKAKEAVDKAKDVAEAVKDTVGPNKMGKYGTIHDDV